MRYALTSGLLFVFAVAMAAVAFAGPRAAPAAQATEPYQVIVPVADTSAASRGKAFAAALAQVLRRESPQPAPSAVLANASTYVQQYQYERAPAGAAQPYRLVVRFAPAAIAHLEKTLAAPPVAAATAPGTAGPIAPPVALDNDHLVWVSGIASAADFADAVATLNNAPGVDGVGVRAARGDGMLLDVRTSIPLARILANLAQGGHLRAAATAHAGAVASLAWSR